MATDTKGLRKAGVILTAENYEDYMRKLRAINQANQEAFNKKPMEEYVAGAKKASQAAKGLSSDTMSLGQKVGLLAKGGMRGLFTKLVGSFAALPPPIAAAAAAIALLTVNLKKFSKEALKVAERNETLGVVLGQVGKNAGYTSDQVEAATSQVKAMGISTSAATHSLTLMAQESIKWTGATKLARVAQDAAVIGMTNSSEAFNRLIYGIKTGQVEILRTIGLNVDFQRSYAQLAVQLNTTVDNLTDQEEMQARVNAVLEAGTKIQGTYEATLDTTSRKTELMAQSIEEAQNNFGQMLLPVKRVSVALKYEFWKGVEQSSLGLKNMGVLIDMITDDFLGLFGTVQEGEGFWEHMGLSLHETTRALAYFMAMVKATVRSVLNDLNIMGAGWNSTFDLITGKKSWEEHVKFMAQVSVDLYESVVQGPAGELGNVMDEMIAKNEHVFESWDEMKNRIKSEANVDLTLQPSAGDNYIKTLEDQIQAVHAYNQALLQAERIVENYNAALSKASESRQKSIEAEEAKHTKSLLALQDKAQESLISAYQNYEDRRAKLIDDYSYRQAKNVEQKNLQEAQEQRRFELGQLQNFRRFKLQEKWLRAEGDVLGVMQLKESYALQKKEAEENRNENLKSAEENNTVQLKLQEEALRRSLRQLDIDLAKRRDEIASSYVDEQAELEEAHSERLASIEQAYIEQLRLAKEQRDEQLTQLGKALQDEKTLTEEGMSKIQTAIAEVFGDEAAGDALITGWKDRSKSEIGIMVDEGIAEIKRLQAEIDKISASGIVPTGRQPNFFAPPEPTSMPFGPGAATYGLPYLPFGRRAPAATYPMREGGVGKVTGPAMFEVEPGQKEYFSFMPESKANRALNVNAAVSGGIDVRGAGNASSGTVDAAVELTMEELRQAIKRMAGR